MKYLALVSFLLFGIPTQLKAETPLTPSDVSQLCESSTAGSVEMSGYLAGSAYKIYNSTYYYPKLRKAIFDLIDLKMATQFNLATPNLALNNLVNTYHPDLPTIQDMEPLLIKLSEYWIQIGQKTAWDQEDLATNIIEQYNYLRDDSEEGYSTFLKLGSLGALDFARHTPTNTCLQCAQAYQIALNWINPKSITMQYNFSNASNTTLSAPELLKDILESREHLKATHLVLKQLLLRYKQAINGELDPTKVPSIGPVDFEQDMRQAIKPLASSKKIVEDFLFLYALRGVQIDSLGELKLSKIQTIAIVSLSHVFHLMHMIDHLYYFGKMSPKKFFGNKKLYSFPQNVSSACYTGKPYHFWMGSELTRRLKEKNISAFAAVWAISKLGKWYEFGGHRGRKEVLGSHQAKSHRAYTAKITLAQRSLGSLYGLGISQKLSFENEVKSLVEDYPTISDEQYLKEAEAAALGIALLNVETKKEKIKGAASLLLHFKALLKRFEVLLPADEYTQKIIETYQIQ